MTGVTVKVQMIARISGSRDGVDWPNVGEAIDVPDAEGADLIALGFAKPVEKASKVSVVETATAPRAENAKATGLTKANGV